MIHILLLVWIGVIAMISVRRNSYETGLNNYATNNKKEISWLLAILTFLPLFFLVANRDITVGDTAAYADTFNQMTKNLDEVINIWSSDSKDKGFYFFTGLVKIYITDNYVWYFALLALIQSISILKLYKQYSSDFIFSVFLFIASTDYISWMCNGIRQFTAVTIILLATSLMLNKKYISFFLVVLFASTFHQSALIMIPIVLICQGEVWNKKTVIFMIAVLISIIFVDSFTNLLDDTLLSTQYVNVVSDYKSFEDNGTNFLRVALYSVPAVLAYWGRSKIKDSGGKVINFCANMSVISAGIYIISMFTSGIYLGRLPIYASLYSYILLPWELKHMFNEAKSRNMYILFISVYVIWFLRNRQTP